MTDIDGKARAYLDYLESLSPESLDRLSDHVEPDVRFADPFNDVSGEKRLRAVFEDMFERTRNLRFEVKDHVLEGNVCYARWRFRCDVEGLKGGELDFEGVSRIVFSAEGRVLEHVDYWDAAQHLFQRVPFLGRVVAAIRRRLAV